MSTLKTETITVRVTPVTKAALKDMAEQERRSLANMIEVMISEYRDRRALKIPAHHDAKA